MQSRRWKGLHHVIRCFHDEITTKDRMGLSQFRFLWPFLARNVSDLPGSPSMGNAVPKSVLNATRVIKVT